MGYHWSEKTSQAILAIVEEVARDYDLDLEEFLFPEGDDLDTRVEAVRRRTLGTSRGGN